MENQSAEFKNSYRINHPDEVEAEMREIKGIMVKPGFGKFVARQTISKLDKAITY